MSLSDRDMSLPDKDASLPNSDTSLLDRDMSPPDRGMSLPDRCVSLRQKSFSLRQSFAFSDCPKSIILAMNQVPVALPVARLGPILSQDGATASKKLSKPLPPCFRPPGPQKDPKTSRSKNWGTNIYKIPLTLPMKLPIHRFGRPIC